MEGDGIFGQVRAANGEHIPLPETACRQPRRRPLDRAHKLAVRQRAPRQAVDEGGFLRVLMGGTEQKFGQRHFRDSYIGIGTFKNHGTKPLDTRWLRGLTDVSERGESIAGLRGGLHSRAIQDTLWPIMTSVLPKDALCQPLCRPSRRPACTSARWSLRILTPFTPR